MKAPWESIPEHRPKEASTFLLKPEVPQDQSVEGNCRVCAGLQGGEPLPSVLVGRTSVPRLEGSLVHKVTDAHAL